MQYPSGCLPSAMLLCVLRNFRVFYERIVSHDGLRAVHFFIQHHLKKQDQIKEKKNTLDHRPSPFLDERSGKFSGASSFSLFQQYKKELHFHAPPGNSVNYSKSYVFLYPSKSAYISRSWFPLLRQPMKWRPPVYSWAEEGWIS